MHTDVSHIDVGMPIWRLDIGLKSEEYLWFHPIVLRDCLGSLDHNVQLSSWKIISSFLVYKRVHRVCLYFRQTTSTASKSALASFSLVEEPVYIKIYPPSSEGKVSRSFLANWQGFF